MRRARVAPTLVYAHKPTPIREVAQGKGVGVRAYNGDAAWRELRALLAVARTARIVLPTRDHPSNCRCWFCHEDRENLTRALARLDSVSRRGGRR